jgi:hypothetical protein
MQSTMTMPTVTEQHLALEPVGRDPFIATLDRQAQPPWSIAAFGPPCTSPGSPSPSSAA